MLALALLGSVAVLQLDRLGDRQEEVSRRTLSGHALLSQVRGDYHDLFGLLGEVAQGTATAAEEHVAAQRARVHESVRAYRDQYLRGAADTPLLEESRTALAAAAPVVDRALTLLRDGSPGEAGAWLREESPKLLAVLSVLDRHAQAGGESLGRSSEELRLLKQRLTSRTALFACVLIAALCVAVAMFVNNPDRSAEGRAPGGSLPAPGTGTPAEEAPEPWLAKSGLNWREGLSLQNGSLPAYREVLRSFVAAEQQVAETLRQALDARDMAGAQRLACAFKERAAGVGANKLAEQGHAIETALRCHDLTAARRRAERIQAPLRELLGVVAGGLHPESTGTRAN